MKHTVNVPKELLPLFEQAELQIANIFKKMGCHPDKGIIEIDNERYLLVRAASLSYDFFDSLVNVFIDKGLEQAIEFSRTFLFDFAHAMGKKDAEYYRQQLGLATPLEILSTGPIHFAYAGWAFVDVSSDSHPTPDQNFFLLYDHIYSFESDSWLRRGKKADIPVCIMNAGYSSGWCETSFKMPLVAIEICCKAKGDDCCRFIMAPPDKINGYIKKYIQTSGGISNQKMAYNVHNFYEIEQYQKKIHDFDRILKENEEKYRVISTYAKEGIILIDNNGTVIFWNQAVEKIMGYSSAEVVGKNLGEVIIPNNFKPEYERLMANRFVHEASMIPGQQLTLEALTKNCQIIPIELSMSSAQINGLWHTVATIHDIKERRSKDRLLLCKKAAINATNAGVIITDHQTNIIDVNPAFTTITGFTKEDVLDKKLSIIFKGKNDYEQYLTIMHDVLVRGMWEGELWRHRKNREKYAEKLCINSIKNSTGVIDQYVAIFSDVTVRKTQEKRIVDQAKIDSLTGILNRLSFIDKLNDAVNTGKHTSMEFAIMFMDIDFFKAVNDEFGHLTGDQLIQQVATRLTKCLKNTDVLARLGGDEFAALLYDIKGVSRIKKVAKKICREMKTPFAIMGNTVSVSVSVGVAVYPNDGEDSDQLIRRSDEAMYRIKSSTRNGYDFWGLSY